MVKFYYSTVSDLLRFKTSNFIHGLRGSTLRRTVSSSIAYFNMKHSSSCDHQGLDIEGPLNNEGEVTYHTNNDEANRFYIRNDAIMKRNMNIAVLRSVVELNKKHSKRKQNSDRNTEKAVWNTVNTHITGLKINRILNISSPDYNGVAPIRFAVEIPGVSEIVSWENIEDNLLQKNIERNNCKDKLHLMQYKDNRAIIEELQLNSHQQSYDAVVIEVKGFPTQFFESALHCISNGGILCTSHPPITCESRGESMNTPYNSELALRLCLQLLHQTAQKNNINILPLLCYSLEDEVIQLFVRIFHNTDLFTCEFPDGSGWFHHCPGCFSFFAQKRALKNQKCQECGTLMQVNGPRIWTSPYFEKQFTYVVFKEVQRRFKQSLIGHKMRLVLAQLEQEVPDALFFHNISNYKTMLNLEKGLSTKLFMSALENLGYESSVTHLDHRGVKTRAPIGAVWDVFRSWVNSLPETHDHDFSESAKIILSRQPSRKVNFFLI